MQQREKILAGGLALALVFWLGLPFFERQFLEPLQRLENQELSLRETIADKFETRKDLAVKDAQLARWRRSSLPPDSLDAQGLYQDWLVRLVQMSGLRTTKVALEPVKTEMGVFTTIPVLVEARGKLQDLSLLLERFHAVDLLHRVAKCDVVSPASDGNPDLTITLVAEGLSLKSAADRTVLFPKTELNEPLTKADGKLKVLNVEGFPTSAPFRIRVGEEFATVTELDGNVWTVQRGIDKTFAAEHDAATVVELYPLRGGDEGREKATIAMWSASLFTKPAPQTQYQPRLAQPEPPTAIRGKDWSWKLEVAGWNPAFGSPTFELLSGPPGMRLDERTATLTWKVSEQAELGPQPIQLLACGSNGRDAGFTPSVTVKVRDPNQTPKIANSGPLRFFIGRESRTPIQAVDPDATPSRLRYEISEAPEGMTIDSTTGVIRWTPPENMAPQSLNVTVKVTDTDEMPESATARFDIVLAEDSAKYTYFTGFISGGAGGTRAMVGDRSSGKASTILREGDRFQLADFDILIEKIFPTYVLVKRDEQMFRWDFEQPLVKMTPVAMAPRPRQEDAPTAAPAATDNTESSPPPAERPTPADTERSAEEQKSGTPESASPRAESSETAPPTDTPASPAAASDSSQSESNP